MVVTDLIMKNIYNAVGHFEMTHSDREVNITIINKPTKEDLKCLYLVLCEKIYPYTLVNTNYDDIFSYQDFLREYINNLRNEM